ncbi:MAG: NAD(P)/FAD-dependent oxidoreductase [Syntrophobacteraceae bacterium]|nr:NAD(P)/FAD-dependent oxidoreductase [Syntrophobacteraceae bacterium]
MENKTFDVVVVGAGPGGCVAAKKCGKAGLRTLLLEKKKLPRDKVCSGMIMGYWAKNLVKDEFGDIPAHVLTGTYRGVTLHTGRNNSITIPAVIPVGWRKNLDYWMCQKATEAGTEVLDAVSINRIVYTEGKYQFDLRKGKDTETVYGRFVIGADGAFSQVRHTFWPDLNIESRAALRECYQGPLKIEKDHFHWFFPRVSPSPRFAVNYKEDHFLIEGGGIKHLRNEIQDIMMSYGLPFEAKPLWRDGCGIASLYNILLDESFLPAKQNVLLVGDAAGLLLPFTQEGIGSALKSGAYAAESVIKALAGIGTAQQYYLGKLREMMRVLKELRTLQLKMAEIAPKGAEALSEAMASFIDKTVNE